MILAAVKIVRHKDAMVLFNEWKLCVHGKLSLRLYYFLFVLSSEVCINYSLTSSKKSSRTPHCYLSNVNRQIPTDTLRYVLSTTTLLLFHVWSQLCHAEIVDWLIIWCEQFFFFPSYLASICIYIFGYGYNEASSLIWKAVR